MWGCLIGTAYIAQRNVCVKCQMPIFWDIFRDEEGLSSGVSSFWGIFRTVRICLPNRHRYSGAYLETRKVWGCFRRIPHWGRDPSPLLLGANQRRGEVAHYIIIHYARCNALCTLCIACKIHHPLAMHYAHYAPASRARVCYFLDIFSTMHCLSTRATTQPFCDTHYCSTRPGTDATDWARSPQWGGAWV